MSSSDSADGEVFSLVWDQSACLKVSSSGADVALCVCRADGRGPGEPEPVRLKVMFSSPVVLLQESRAE